MDIREHEGKFHVMEDDAPVGVFRTRRGALAFAAQMTRDATAVGPWASAARRSRAVQEVHEHQPLQEGLDLLVHIHEFDEIGHTHPGYGPGMLAEDEQDDPGPDGQ